MKKKTFRDELAMSLPFEAIPSLENMEARKQFCEEHDLDFGDSLSDQIQFILEYQSIIRYMYADAMLTNRNRNND